MPLEPIDTDYEITPDEDRSGYGHQPAELLTGVSGLEFTSGLTAYNNEPTDFDIRRRALEFAVDTAPRFDGSIAIEPHEIVSTAELFRRFLVGEIEFEPITDFVYPAETPTED